MGRSAKENFGDPQKNSLRSSENKGEKYRTIFTADEESVTCT